MIEKNLNDFIKNALAEDIGDGDHTSLASIPVEATNKAHLLVKDKGINKFEGFCVRIALGVHVFALPLYRSVPSHMCLPSLEHILA